MKCSNCTEQSAVTHEGKDLCPTCYCDALEPKDLESKRPGIRWCVAKLRELQSQFRHERQWNHSSSTNFAPVELSDYLILEFEKALKKK